MYWFVQSKWRHVIRKVEKNQSSMEKDEHRTKKKNWVSSNWLRGWEKSPKFRFESAIRRRRATRLQWSISRQSSRFQHPLEEVAHISRTHTLLTKFISSATSSFFFNYFVCFFPASASHNPLEIMDDLDWMKRALITSHNFLDESSFTKSRSKWDGAIACYQFTGL